MLWLQRQVYISMCFRKYIEMCPAIFSIPVPPFFFLFVFSPIPLKP
jgi:hypothetical protein